MCKTGRELKLPNHIFCSFWEIQKTENADGDKSSTREFSVKTDAGLEKLAGVYLIADDVLITAEGETIDQVLNAHDRMFRKFLERCRETDQVQTQKMGSNLYGKSVNSRGTDN